MELPKVVNVATDPKRNIRFEIIAYKKLSEQEMLVIIEIYRKSHKLKNNSIYVINTTVNNDSII